MRNAYFFPLKPAAVLGGFLLLMPMAAVAGGDEPRLSISGYDPVAYFTDGKPVQGKSEIEYLWHKLRWRFANGEHRDLFAKNLTATRRNTTATVPWVCQPARKGTRTRSTPRRGR